MTRRAAFAGRLALAGALLAATWPAWRILVAGGEPTIDELLQLRCSSQADPAAGFGMRRPLADEATAAKAGPGRNVQPGARLQPFAGT